MGEDKIVEFLNSQVYKYSNYISVTYGVYNNG